MIQAFFFDLQAIKSGSLRPAGVAPFTATRLGVLGAGMMGAGIAYQAARSGIEVVLKDVTVEAAEKGRAYSATLLDKQIARGRMTEERKAEILARITPTADPADLAGCDSVIEAVFEDPSLKAKVYAEVQDVVNPDALLCSNTSTLPITELAGAVNRPEDFIGMHFFSPVDKMPLVEIIRGEKTSAGDGRPRDRRRAADQEDADRGQRQPWVLHVAGLRHAAHRGGRAARGGRRPADHRAGRDDGRVPGAAAGDARRGVADAEPDDPQGHRGGRRPRRDRPARAARHRGRSSGWSRSSAAGEGCRGRVLRLPGRRRGRRKRLWPGLREHFTKAGTEVPLVDIQERYLFRMALETARCFDEGVIESAAAANIGSIMGIGFPPLLRWRGAVHAGLRGPRRHRRWPGFVARARELAAAYGDRFDPPPYLVDLAEKGERFPA